MMRPQSDQLNHYTATRCEIYSQLMVKILQVLHCRRSSVFLEAFKNIPYSDSRFHCLKIQYWCKNMLFWFFFFIIKEHQFTRNVLDEDNLKKSDALKKLSAYYEMFNKLLKVFILLEDTIKCSENFDEIVGKDLKDLPREVCVFRVILVRIFPHSD